MLLCTVFLLHFLKKLKNTITFKTIAKQNFFKRNIENIDREIDFVSRSKL